MKAYGFRGRAGCVTIRVARETGREVGIYRNDQAGLDDDEGCYPWSTVCEEHGTIICHATLRLAKLHSSNPLGWCETCRAVEDDAESASTEELEAAAAILESRHPDARVVRAYNDRYGACVRAGFSQADAREQATIERDRVARSLR